MKKWLRKVLGVNDLEGKQIELQKSIEELSREISSVKELNQKVISQNDFILSQFNISADIYPRENHSWAVISIQGKPEYVKFVNLSNRDMRSVHEYLKQFERTNRTIDSPFGYADLVKW